MNLRLDASQAGIALPLSLLLSTFLAILLTGLIERIEADPAVLNDEHRRMKRLNQLQFVVDQTWHSMESGRNMGISAISSQTGDAVSVQVHWRGDSTACMAIKQPTCRVFEIEAILDKQGGMFKGGRMRLLKGGVMLGQTQETAPLKRIFLPLYWRLVE